MRPLEKISAKILITVLAIALSGISGFGQDYKKMASDFLRSKFEKMNVQINSIDFDHESSNGSLILLESSRPPCFILLKPDGDKYLIMGYETNKVFYVDPMNKEMAADFLEAVDAIPVRKLRMKSGMTTPFVPVGPLCKTKWNQNRWYNRYCPYSVESSAGERTYAGCVAVAMGQVIRYYGKWNDLRLGGESGNAIPDYDLGGMIDRPTNYDVDVCKFLADLGSFVDMDYGPSASSCSFGLAWKDMQRGIYCEADRTIQRQDEKWLEKIYKNLGAYHPVVVGGKGHAFVCDGYDEDGMLHFNLGWSGTGDGFYHYNTISLDGYYSLNEAIIEAYPHKHENYPSPGRIYIDGSSGIPKISWHAPDRKDVTGYKVYYSDNDYLTTSDTVLEIRKLKPGTRGMMVSAIYPDGESIWIGPAWVHNPGREVEFRESSLVKALALQNIQPAGTSQVVIRTEGELADMRSLTIADPIDNFGILRKIPDLQALTINCSLAGSEDVELIQGLKNLQTLYLIDCKGDVLPDFKSLPKLVELGLRDSHLEDLAFVDDIRSLLALDLKGCTLEKGFTLPSSLDDLEHLRIEDMEVKTAGFLNKCINLRELKIVNCQLEEIRSGSENPHVIWLNLEKNQLKNTTFLGRFPNLKVFMAAHNQIWSLEMHAPLPWLYSIDLSYNQISKVSLAFDYKSLQEIILKDNQLIGIPGFYTVPNLRVLNVSGNDIEKLGRCVNTKIEVLNISSNRLNVLNGIELYSNLKTLLAVNNRISDLRPLLDAVNGFNPGRIDMRNNPVSKESFREVIPVLTGRGVSLQVPPQFEPASPCYPEVIVNEFNGSKNLQLKWQTDSGLPELGFDVYIGVGDTMWACSTGIFERLKELNLEKGQVYNWQVLARYNDTTFYSGQYRIEELDDMALQLPYYDNFEKYSPDAGISASSPVWKLTNGNNRFEANAVVSELTASYGQGKSLHIGNNSDVSLRLAHLETGYLRIEMDQYVIPGKASHVCLNNIAGLKIDLVSDGYNSGIYLNESAQGNIEIKLNAWNNWRIVFSGSNDYIKVECNDQQILFNHLFNDKMVRIGSMQFGPVPFETGLQVKEYESYIDNLAITDGSRSATSESILASDAMVSVFPNPANDYLYVEGLNTDQGQYTISIFATSGQLVKQVSLGSPGGRVQVGVSDLPCGNYVYQISLPEVRVAGGMFIVYR